MPRISHPLAYGNIEGSKTILIVGVDSGTTSFKCALCEAREVNVDRGTPFLVQLPTQTIEVVADYPGSHQDELIYSSTSLIYNEVGELAKWGHEATNFQNHPDFDPKLLVDYWKLAARKPSTLAVQQLQKRLEEIAQRFGRSPNTFISDFFRAVSSFLFGKDGRALQNSLGSLDDYRFIDVVIPVPPGWSREEHRTFSHAAAVGLGMRPNLRVFTVSETECALRTWMHQGGYRLVKYGDIIVLVDLGGGTSCISVFQYEALENSHGKWLHIESHSLDAGSEIVTEAFLADVRRRINGINGLPTLSKIIYEARRLFEIKKKSVGEDPIERPWHIPIPGLEPNPFRKDFGNNKLIFSGEELLGYFQPSQDLLFTKIKEVVARITKDFEKPRYFLMAGAYSKNLLIKKRLKEADLDVQPVYPQPLAELVVRGACHARIQGDFRQFSGSRYSIGIVTYVKWKEVGIKYPKVFKRKFNGSDDWWCPVIFWMIKKGEHVDPSAGIKDEKGEPWKRYFEPDEDIAFTDTIVTSESFIPPEKFTTLEYNSADETLWKENIHNLRERRIEIELSEVTWDISKTQRRRGDGSWAAFTRSCLWIDNNDTRKSKRRFLLYTYYLSLTQTDVQITIEAHFVGSHRHAIIVGKREVVVLNERETESKALEDEYANLPQNNDSDGGSPSDTDLEHATPQTSRFVLEDIRARAPRTQYANSRGQEETSDCGSNPQRQKGTPISRKYPARTAQVNIAEPSREPSQFTQDSWAPSTRYLQELATSAGELFHCNDEATTQNRPRQSRTPSNFNSRSNSRNRGNSRRRRSSPHYLDPRMISRRRKSRCRTYDSDSRHSSPASNATDIYEPPDSDSNFSDDIPRKKKPRPSLREPVVQPKKQSWNAIRKPKKTR